MPKPKKSNPEIEIKLRITDQPQPPPRQRHMPLRLRIKPPAPRNAPATSREERVILTSKASPHSQQNKKQSRYKIRAEREQVVSTSSRRYAKTLTYLGFRPTFRYDKFRTTFHLPNLHLDLDETPAGAYLELEGNPKAIDRAAKALGFTKKHYLRATYWDLYAAACRRRGTKPKNMLFPRK